MESSENLEKITVHCRGVRNTGITKEKTEKRPDGGPKDEQGEKNRSFGTVNHFHEIGNHVGGFGRLFPGNDPDDRQVNEDVNGGHDQEADKNGLGKYPRGVFDFLAQVADLVIAQIIVYGDSADGAQREEKFRV